jgi:hypothetical protein
MSYPDYTNEESLRVTPVVDVISDLTSAVNLRVRNLAWCYTNIWGLPNYAGAQIAELPDLTIYQIIQAIQLIRGKINEVCIYCRPANITNWQQLNRYQAAAIETFLASAGYSAGYIDYTFQQCRAEIFIQLKRVIEQLKYLDLQWYTRYANAMNAQYNEYDNRYTPPWLPAITVTRKVTSNVCRASNPFRDDNNVWRTGYGWWLGPANSLTAAPIKCGLYYSQIDFRLTMTQNGYTSTPEYWADFWGFGQSGVLYIGEVDAGSGVSVPAISPNIAYWGDKPNNDRVSELNIAMLGDISITFKP